jgi:hypothetical protein
MMHKVFSNPDLWKDQKAGPPAREFFAVFRWFYAFLRCYLVVCFVINLLSAIFLGRRTCRTFSIVVGYLNVLHIPLGTILGAFTLVVLLRPSVRQLYGDSAALAAGGLVR